jgi:RimJ/RimL family protein N-acetyltransferase
VITPPARIAIDGQVFLRQLCVDDAEAVALAVEESLDHLRPWMPWANAQSADAAFQRERIAKLGALAASGDEWQYGLFPLDESKLLGSFGLMTRRGPGTIEIGYWVHVDSCRQGHATRAARTLTELANTFDRVQKVLICCDEANVASAAIPNRLGYRLDSVQARAPQAPGERGRLMTWAIDQGTRHTSRA